MLHMDWLSMGVTVVTVIDKGPRRDRCAGSTLSARVATRSSGICKAAVATTGSVDGHVNRKNNLLLLVSSSARRCPRFPVRHRMITLLFPRL